MKISTSLYRDVLYNNKGNKMSQEQLTQIENKIDKLIQVQENQTVKINEIYSAFNKVSPEALKETASAGLAKAKSILERFKKTKIETQQSTNQDTQLSQPPQLDTPQSNLDQSQGVTPENGATNLDNQNGNQNGNQVDVNNQNNQ